MAGVSLLDAEPSIRQYSRRTVLGIWAAAALPMAALAWLVVPALAGSAAGTARTAELLIGALCLGLVWQFVLVVVLVARQRQGTGWPAVRDALWLRAPSTADRRGGRLWWWALPFVVGFAVVQLIPWHLPKVASHDLGTFLGSASGKAALHGNWGLFALAVVLLLFNTVLGEELLFRGLLLPRMRGAFGRADWVVNGLLFGVYHLHEPWAIPGSVLAGLLFAYASKRWRSAWLGIVVHSVQSVFFVVLLLGLVLS